MYDIGLFTYYKTMTSKLKPDVLLYLGLIFIQTFRKSFLFFASRQPAAHGHIQRGIGHCYHRTIGLEVFLQQHHRGLRFQKIRELAPKWGYQKRTQLCLFFFVLNYPDYEFICETVVKSFWALPKWEGVGRLTISDLNSWKTSYRMLPSWSKETPETWNVWMSCI